MNIGNASNAKDRSQMISALSSELGLSFSSYVMVGNKLIALDGIGKRLMVTEGDNEWSEPLIIELNKLAGVFVKKSYGSIRSGELKYKGFEEFLEKIDLQFVYVGDDEPVVLSFYNNETDLIRELPALERIAKNWQLILSGMTVPKSKINS